MDKPKLLSYFNEKEADMLGVIETLVSQETPSSDKTRLDAFAETLVERLNNAGADAGIIINNAQDAGIPRGNHVRATFTPAGTEGETPALILCHYDTVWPVGSLATHPFRIETDPDSGERKAYGPGIFDMQSSIMMSEYALRAIQDLSLTLPRPITILITSDEEVGSTTSKELIESTARESAYALVMESPLPGGVIKTARKGCGRFVVETTGIAAHSGLEPEKGVSAILEMTHHIQALYTLIDWEKETTLSVGTIQGGTAANVVPAHASVEVDVRVWTPEEVERIEQAVFNMEPVLPGAQVHVTGGINRLPLERKVTGEIFERAKAIGTTLGLDLQEGSTGGGSDGNLTGALGVPTLDGLGIPGHGAHADHEHILVNEMASRTALLVALLCEL